MEEKKVDIFVSWDPGAEGITERSLRMLRMALVAAYWQKTAVVKVPTSDGTCGFLVVIRRPVPPSGLTLKEMPWRNRLEATWSGDGFRTDDGEGGAGMRAASALLSVFGLFPRIVLAEPWIYEHVTTQGFGSLADQRHKALKRMATEVVASLGDGAFAVPAELKPGY